jgi:hypothetical protein
MWLAWAPSMQGGHQKRRSVHKKTASYHRLGRNLGRPKPCRDAIVGTTSPRIHEATRRARGGDADRRTASTVGPTTAGARPAGSLITCRLGLAGALAAAGT